MPFLTFTTPPTQRCLGPFLLLLAGAALLLSACAHRGRVPLEVPPPPAPQVSQVPYQLQPLDRLVTTSSSGERFEIVVPAEGEALLPDGTTLPLAGLTTTDAKARIEAKVPQLRVIQFIEFRAERISVVGEVARPSNLPLSEAPMRLMDAIAMAGGFTPLADATRVTLVRQNADTVETYLLNLKRLLQGRGTEDNIFLQPGDVISVPRALF